MFGERLIQLRKKQGYSQQEVADRLQVSRQTISNWECDQAMPALDKAAELAALYQVSLDELAALAKKEKKEEVMGRVEMLSTASKDLHLLYDMLGRSCTIEYVGGVAVPEKQILEGAVVTRFEENVVYLRFEDESGQTVERGLKLDAIHYFSFTDE